MSIYSQEKIKTSLIYGPLMESINDLYVECGQPAQMPGNEPGNTSTAYAGADQWMSACSGDNPDDKWDSDNIGDWEGQEEIVAELAQQALRDLYDELSLINCGGIYHAHCTPEWNDFIESAQALINQYDDFTALCEADAEQLDLRIANGEPF